MLGLPSVELAAPLRSKLLFRRRQFGFRFRSATTLAVRLLSFDRLITGPTSILVFLCHCLLLEIAEDGCQPSNTRRMSPSATANSRCAASAPPCEMLLLRNGLEMPDRAIGISSAQSHN